MDQYVYAYCLCICLYILQTFNFKLGNNVNEKLKLGFDKYFSKNWKISNDLIHHHNAAL